MVGMKPVEGPDDPLLYKENGRFAHAEIASCDSWATLWGTVAGRLRNGLVTETIKFPQLDEEAHATEFAMVPEPCKEA
jgi:hypothetical protein